MKKMTDLINHKAGKSGQVLISTGNGLPTWQDPCNCPCCIRNQREKDQQWEEPVGLLSEGWE